MNNERELNQIQQDVDTLHNRTQDTKLQLSTHEAVCAERYENIMKHFEQLQEQIQYTYEELTELRTLATQGRSTLKTLVFIGVFVSGCIGLAYTILSMIK